MFIRRYHHLAAVITLVGMSLAPSPLYCAEENLHYLLGLRDKTGPYDNIRNHNISIVETVGGSITQTDNLLCTHSPKRISASIEEVQKKLEMTITIDGKTSKISFSNFAPPKGLLGMRITRPRQTLVHSDNFVKAWRGNKYGAELGLFKKDRLGLQEPYDELEMFPRISDVKLTTNLSLPQSIEYSYSVFRKGGRVAPGLLNVGYKRERRSKIIEYLKHSTPYEIGMKDDYQECRHNLVSAKVYVPFFTEFHYANTLRQIELFEFVYPLEVDIGGGSTVYLYTSPSRLGFSGRQFAADLDRSSNQVYNRLKGAIETLLDRSKSLWRSNASDVKISIVSDIRKPFLYNLTLFGPQRNFWGNDSGIWESHEFRIRLSPTFLADYGDDLTLEVSIDSQTAKYGLQRILSGPPATMSYDVSLERIEKLRDEIARVFIDKNIGRSGEIR